ncbi:MAG: hypothetical protein LBF90_05185 [Prevotellaceae bacterium]|nr:hypothetical protein [Prevotellaceae bacterium]
MQPFSVQSAHIRRTAKDKKTAARMGRRVGGEGSLQRLPVTNSRRWRRRPCRGR